MQVTVDTKDIQALEQRNDWLLALLIGVCRAAEGDVVLSPEAVQAARGYTLRYDSVDGGGVVLSVHGEQSDAK